MKPHYRLHYRIAGYRLDGNHPYGWCVVFNGRRTAYMISALAACNRAAYGDFYTAE